MSNATRKLGLFGGTTNTSGRQSTGFKVRVAGEAAGKAGSAGSWSVKAWGLHSVPGAAEARGQETKCRGGRRREGGGGPELAQPEWGQTEATWQPLRTLAGAARLC